MHRAGLGFIDSRPISYLGIDPATARLFSVSLVVSAVLFISFGYYIRRTYHIQNKFLGYLIIGQIGQIIAAVTPYGHRQPFKFIHTIAAFVLAFTLLFLIREFTHSQNKNRFRTIYSSLFTIEKITFVVGIGLFIFTKGIAPLGEALPATGFHIWIITITILSNARRSLKRQAPAR